MTSVSSEVVSQKIRVQIIAKAPLAGFAKTRLIPALGADAAAALAEKMLLNIIRNCATVTEVDGVTVKSSLWMSPEPESPHWQCVNIPDNFERYAQQGEDLGERMAGAFERGLVDACAVIVVGSDCPEIDASVLHWAATALQAHDACLVPCVDGGYALIGLRKFEASIFADIPWSTDRVADLTRQRLAECGMSCAEYELVHDIDIAEDLAYLPADWPESACRA